jgi:hypothetical protein
MLHQVTLTVHVAGPGLVFHGQLQDLVKDGHRLVGGLGKAEVVVLEAALINHVHKPAARNQQLQVNQLLDVTSNAQCGKVEMAVLLTTMFNSAVALEWAS